MGNPCRHIFQGKFVKRPTVNEEKKEVTFSYYDGKLEEFYDVATCDFYSAPDVIMSYTNGNTCKDEWRRYIRSTFKGLKIIKIEVPLVEGEYTAYTYSYEEAISKHFQFGDPEMETDIPIGKFAGLTYKQVQDYKRKNRYQFGKPPEPSDEAIEAAYKVAVNRGEWLYPTYFFEEVKEMLKAAYKIDM